MAGASDARINWSGGIDNQRMIHSIGAVVAGIIACPDLPREQALCQPRCVKSFCSVTVSVRRSGHASTIRIRIAHTAAAGVCRCVPRQARS